MLKDQLKFLRESRKLTKKQVADSIKITERAYITYEYGQRDISTETLQKFADFYGVTTDYLLGRPDAKPPADPVEEFVNKTQLQKQEQIILKKWLALNEKQREAVFDFMVDIVHEYESASVQSNAQSQPERETAQKDVIERPNVKIVQKVARDNPDKNAPVVQYVETTAEEEDELLSRPLLNPDL